MTAITNPGQIALYRLATLRTALKLEARGLKMSKGPTALSVLRKDYGYKGSRDKILAQVTADVAAQMAELETNQGEIK
jgi:hypothetical protein